MDLKDDERAVLTEVRERLTQAAAHDRPPGDSGIGYVMPSAPIRLLAAEIHDYLDGTKESDADSIHPWRTGDRVFWRNRIGDLMAGKVLAVACDSATVIADGAPRDLGPVIVPLESLLTGVASEPKPFSDGILNQVTGKTANTIAGTYKDEVVNGRKGEPDTIAPARFKPGDQVSWVVYRRWPEAHGTVEEVRPHPVNDYAVVRMDYPRAGTTEVNLGILKHTPEGFEPQPAFASGTPVYWWDIAGHLTRGLVFSAEPGPEGTVRVISPDGTTFDTGADRLSATFPPK